MAIANWPSISDKIERDGLTYKKQDNVAKTDMDNGPSKKRKRYTAVSTYVSGDLQVSRDELLIFLDWYDNTIGSGALLFNFTDPILLDTVPFRFLNAESPEIGFLDGEYYIIPLELERLPQ